MTSTPLSSGINDADEYQFKDTISEVADEEDYEGNGEGDEWDFFDDEEGDEE